MFSCRAMGIDIKKKLYKGISVPTALYGAKTWSMAIAKKIFNAMEMKCLRSMCGVTRMDQVRNEV